MATCAQMGKGFAALGNFTCAECRLKKVLMPGVTPTPQERNMVEKTMVLEMGQGAESSAAGFAEYTRLEREFSLGLGKFMSTEDEGQRFVLPRHHPEAYKNFLSWLALERERAKSLETIQRTAGAFFAKLELQPMTTLPAVKAHFNDLVKKVGITHDPATTATARMLKYIVCTGTAKRFSNLFLRSRENIQVICEGVGGCRIGEVCGGGDVHGLLANNTAILEDLAVGGDPSRRVVVEMKLEHSKTGYSRYLTMAGTTSTSQIEVANALRTYWREAGMFTETEVVAGVKVTRPDFYVARVSLLGMEAGCEQFEKLVWFLETTINPSASSTARSTIVDAKRRLAAQDGPHKKYINVAMGRRRDQNLQRIATQLSELGFQVTVVAGPLLLGTTGGKYPKVKTMPLATSSAFAPTKELLTAAWEFATSDPQDPDPDLELGMGEIPKWTTHSLRRLADTTARRYREQSGVTADEIDIYFGWNERVLLKAMQYHYATMSIRERMEHARITGFM